MHSSERLTHRFIMISLLLMLRFVLPVFSCSSLFGPSGTTTCVQLQGYNHEYQWGTCLTDNYIIAKSGHQHICVDSQATYCYYQCMLELYNEESGHVEVCCKCIPGQQYSVSDLTLPDTCYSPSGTDCNWYENCLERTYTCKGTADDYAMEFATKFCKLYNENFGDFSEEGQKWVDAVRKCLQLSLVPIIRPWCSKTCNEIKKIAFDSHVPCYVNPDKHDSLISICNLNYKDFFRVFWTVKSSLIMKASIIATLEGFMNTANDCYIKPATDALNDILKPVYDDIHESLIKMKGKIENLLKRNRRSILSKEDVLLLAHNISENIAAKLELDEKNILWYGTVDGNTSLLLAENEMIILLYLADRKTYDLNTKNLTVSDMTSVLTDFKKKVQAGEFNDRFGNVVFQINSAEGCDDIQCNSTYFDLTVLPTKMAESTVNLIYVIIGISVGGFIICALTGISIYYWRKRTKTTT